ncbi:MAG: peptidase M61 [Bacteroidota bacterium]
MKKQLIVVLLALAFCTKAMAAGGGDKYQYVVDLTEVVDDKLMVQLITPKISSAEITFYLPKIIPGTYSIADYGRFVSEFKAYDKKGRELEVERLDDNSWKISKANKLNRISYWIEDSFDTILDGPSIFQPAGTNFEEGENFVINTSGFFGYFEGMKQKQFDFSIIRSENFYGGTGLIPTNDANNLNTVLKLEGVKQAPAGKKIDTYSVENYDRLVDSPLMYAEADTAVINVANTEVLVSSYSPNDMITAKEIAANIEEILNAQSEYLGGQLPVNKYAFIFYFTDQPVTSYGALEHSYSSLYYMPEATIEQMEQQLRDFAAHEFFHIVTPLNIHSEEIHEFDFNDPQMSEHLWLYEGVTEYFAGNVQVKYDIITPEEYLQIIRQKMVTATAVFNDTLPFTELSKYTLDKYPDQYGNVYEKGALIGMCIDIKLRSLSDRKYGLQNLMADLSTKYGKDQAFKDDELFGEIINLTYPEIGEFLNTYVAGSSQLPFQEIFKLVGVDYVERETYQDYSLGIEQYNVGFDEEKGQLFIRNAERLNKFGQALGFQNGDILAGINDEDFPPVGPQLGQFIGQKQQAMKEGDEFVFNVLRDNENGELEKVRLVTTIFRIDRYVLHQLGFSDDASEEQLALRKSWLQAN